MSDEREDLTTAEGARIMLAQMKAYAAGRFREDGDLPPMAVMLERQDPDTRKLLPAPRLAYYFIDSGIANDHGPRGGKANLALMLRGNARRTDALAFCWMSEAWLLEGKQQTPAGSWEHVPGRKECLHLTFQHRALGQRTFITRAFIERDKRGKPTLGDWQDTELASAEGRFVDVLPKVDA